jgi:septal ring factor EnvC (AmiA/AmiB activator)
MPKKEDKTTIILEEMRSNFRLSFEGQAALKEEIKKVNDRLTASDKKHDLTAQILSEQIKEVKTELGEVKTDLQEVKTELKEVHSKVDHLDQKLDSHIQQPAHA